MMSAAAMSAMIRAKKKTMEEDESGAVKLSGIPEDATDILVNKNKEYGEMLSENVPMEHSNGEDLTPSAEEEEEKKSKFDKIRAMMGRMAI